jgi:hypothetical protein
MKLVEFLRNKLDELIYKEASKVNEAAKAYFFARQGSVESPEEPYLKVFAGFKEKDRKKWEKVWDSMTKGKVHKWTACVNKMKGKVDNPKAYCQALADFVGYDKSTGRKSKKKKKSKSKSKSKRKKGSIEFIHIDHLPSYIKEIGFEKAYSKFKTGSVYIRTDAGIIPGRKFALLMKSASRFLRRIDERIRPYISDTESRRMLSFAIGLKVASVDLLRTIERRRGFAIEKLATALGNYDTLKKIISSFTRYIITSEPNALKKIYPLFKSFPKLDSNIEFENLKNILASIDVKKLYHEATIFALAQAEEPGTDLGKESESADAKKNISETPTTVDPNTGKPVSPEEQMKKDQKFMDCKNRLSPYLGEEAAEETCKSITQGNNAQ